MREDAGLSLRDLAKKSGVSHSAISAIERGGDTKTENVKKLAKFFSVSVDFLISGNEPSATFMRAKIAVESHKPDDCQFMKEMQREFEYIKIQEDFGRIENETAKFELALKVVLPNRATEIMGWLKGGPVSVQKRTHSQKAFTKFRRKRLKAA